MTSSKRLVITIDGLAGSGKTAVSRELARKINFRYLSSGLLYRAVGYLALIHKIPYTAPEQLLPILEKSDIRLEPTADLNNSLILDGVNVTAMILKPEVSEAASTLAAHQLIRTYLLAMQQQAFPGEHLVAEGRDMGTVVFPDAPVKVFLTCSPEILAERRLEQILKHNPQAQQLNSQDLREQLRIEIEERNIRDAQRAIAPTVPAVDALVVDNSQQTLTEAVSFVYDYATRSLGL